MLATRELKPSNVVASVLCSRQTARGRPPPLWNAYQMARRVPFVVLLAVASSNEPVDVDVEQIGCTRV